MFCARLGEAVVTHVCTLVQPGCYSNPKLTTAAGGNGKLVWGLEGGRSFGNQEGFGEDV